MTTLRIMLAVILIALATASAVSAQSALNLTSDDRYAGYKGIAIEWPSSQPDLAACKAGEYYEPSATNLARFATPEDRVRLQEHDECTWMITTTGWRWVLRRAGTKVAVDKEGRDLYDLGRNDGKVCKNPRPFSIPYIPVAEVTPTPAPEPCNCPPPTVVVEVVLPPWEPTELVAMPPDLPDPPSYDFQTTLVWENGKRWWWKYTPLFCVDVRSPRDLWKPAMCAAVAAGGYALAGGFSGGGTPLVKIPFRVPTIVP